MKKALILATALVSFVATADMVQEPIEITTATMLQLEDIKFSNDKLTAYFKPVPSSSGSAKRDRDERKLHAHLVENDCVLNGLVVKDIVSMRYQISESMLVCRTKREKIKGFLIDNVDGRSGIDVWNLEKKSSFVITSSLKLN